MEQAPKGIEILEIDARHCDVRTRVDFSNEVERSRRRMDSNACRIVRIKGDIAEGLNRLGVGPLTSLRVGLGNEDLLHDESVPFEVRTQALEAHAAVAHGVQVAERHGLRIHRPAAGIEIGIFPLKDGES